MKNKKSIWMSVAIALVLSGCARDQTVQDYNYAQVQKQEAQINALSGDYQGMLLMKSDHQTPIAGLKIHAEATRTTVSGGSTPLPQQQAALQLTLSLDGGEGTPMSLTFTNAGLDPTALQFNTSVSVPVSVGGNTTATVNINGTFSGNTIVGTVDAGYEDRAAWFSLTLGATAPVAADLKSSRVAKVNKFLYQKFEAASPTFSSRYGADPSPIYMSVLRSSQQTAQEQNFVSVFLQDRPVDISFYRHYTDANGVPHDYNGGIFPGAIWDDTAQTLYGVVTVPASAGQAAQENSVSCTQTSVGWNCQDTNLTQGPLFSGLFTPMGAQQ